MNSYATSALSLQARLNSLQPQPAAVAVDPKGFKAALQSFIQFLIDQEVSATLWLKLPKGEAWWEDIWQYGQQAIGCTIYILGDQVENPPDTLAASLRPIPIDSTGALKKEYLCLAVAPNFMGALLAARTNTPASTALPPNSKRNLQLYCTTAARTMSALSAGIKSILESSLPAVARETLTSTPPTTDQDERNIAAAAALSQWGRSFPANILNQNVLPLSESFLAWQLQCQENLRSQLNEYRQAAPEQASHPKVSALSESFLSRASQELQAPLTTIKTALTLLGSPTLKLVQRQRYLEMIATQCEHQKALITSIIELLQIQTTDMAAAHPIRLCDLIPGIVSTYQPIAEEKGIMLAYTVPDHLAEVVSVESELKQIVIHLINNGIQVTPKDGRIWVSAKAEGDSFIALNVQDSGSSIAKTDLDQLFKPFYQTTHGTNGTGLDLTLVQQLVKRMGGHISVESNLGYGNNFKILLPLSTEANSSAATPAYEKPGHEMSSTFQQTSHVASAKS
ncbi:MAG: ATP-binding protein [Cyanobacteria bacterium J06621_11]